MTACDKRRGGVRGCGCVIIGLLKTVRFAVSFRIEFWIDFCFCGSMGFVVLKVCGGDSEKDGNCVQNQYSRVRHGFLIVLIIILEFLPEFLWLEYHCFGFIGHRIRE